MPDYIIEVETNGREVYTITADTEEEAKLILYRDAPRPTVSEAISFEIINIKED